MLDNSDQGNYNTSCINELQQPFLKWRLTHSKPNTEILNINWRIYKNIQNLNFIIQKISNSKNKISTPNTPVQIYISLTIIRTEEACYLMSGDVLLLNTVTELCYG